MKSWAGKVSLLLGAFLLIAGAIAQFWASDAAKRTPLDTDSFTRLTGSASGVLVDKDDTESVKPVKYTVHTQADPNASTSDVVAFVETSCINVDEGDPADCLDVSDDRVVNNSFEKFATDRHTALAVADQAKYIPDSTVDYQGLINKWPFDPEKKTYPYWDGTLGKAVDATYVGEKTIDGVDTYSYQIDIPETDAEIAKDTEGTYEAHQTVWVDTVTGAFIDQEGSQKIKTTDGTNVLDIEVSYTDETVANNASDAKANGRTLMIVTKVIPIAGFAGGLVLLGLGGFLIMKGRRKA